MKFVIWWSPMGEHKGQAIVEALSLDEAKMFAFNEMRKRSDCGAYGAEPACPRLKER